MSEGEQPFVSIIIPVYNDGEPLKTCLESLENQTYPKERYQAIVVDNGSDEDIASVVKNFSQAITIYEEKPGSYTARNKGISVAPGDAIAFTDADCIPAADWIEKGVENLLRVPNCGLVAGKIEFFCKEPGQPTAIEFYDMIFFLNQKTYIKEKKFGATANLFTWKNVFDKVGVFDAQLKSGGDHEWGNRVYARGYQLIYAEDARVKHPARSSFRQLYKKVMRINKNIYGTKNIDEGGMMSLIVEVGQRLKPPVKFLRWRLSDTRLKGIKQKLLFVLVTVFLDYAIAWEKFKSKIWVRSPLTPR